MAYYCGNTDVSHDVRSLMTNHQLLHNELDKLENLTDETNIDSDYDYMLRFVLRNFEMHEQNITEREDFMHIDDEVVDDNDDDDDDDDADSEVDPDHERFFSMLKEHGNAYALDLDAVDNNKVPLFVEFEAETSFEDEWEDEYLRKTRSCAEEMNVIPYHNGSDHSRDQSGKPNGRKQNPRMLVNQLQIEVSCKKPPAGPKAKGLMQNGHSFDSQAPISRKGDLGRRRILGNTGERETPVQIDKELLSQKSGPRIMRCENDDQVRYGGIKLGKSVIETGVEIDKVRFYQKLGPSNLIRDNEYDNVYQSKVRHVVRGKTMAVENWYANPDPVRTGEKNKVQNRRKTSEVIKGKNIVNEEHELNRIDMVQIDNARFYQKLSPRNSRVTNNPYECADRARPGDKDKAWSLINVKGLVKGKDVVKEKDKAKRKTLVMSENERSHKRHLQRSNQVGQYHNDNVYQVEPLAKCKAENHRKQVKGKSVVQEQNEANRKAIVLIDDDDLDQKPKVVNQVQLVKKDKVWSNRKSMKVGHSSQKTTFGIYNAKNQLNHNVKALSNRKEIHSKVRNANSNKCLVVCEKKKKKKDEKNREKESDGEIVPDVEILDGSAFLQKGALTPFVPSKMFGSVCRLLTKLRLLLSS